VLPEINPAHSFTSLKIVPFASGWRDDNIKELTLSTLYSELGSHLTEADSNTDAKHSKIDKSSPLLSALYDLESTLGSRSRIDIEDLGIVIAWNEIESLTIFDENVHKWLQSQTPVSAKVAHANDYSMIVCGFR
jgi:hypothetical protein